MPRGLPFALAGAVTSVALFMSFAWAPFAMPLIGYFVQLPLLLVGLTLGPVTAAVASVGATAIAALVGGVLVAALFFVMELVPTLYVVSRSLRRSPGHDGAGGWYPVGNILAELALGAAVVVTAGVILVEVNTGDVAAAISSLLTEIGQMSGNATIASALGAGWLATLLPGIVIVSWLVMIVMNSLIAQRIAVKAGIAQRPSPVLSDLSLPVWCSIAMAVAALPAVLGAGWALYAGRGALLAMLVPFFFLGLGVIHTALRGLPQRRFAIVTFYLVLFIVSWPIVLAVTGLGLIEDVAQLRRRFA